jgi:hypothetical protein
LLRSPLVTNINIKINNDKNINLSLFLCINTDLANNINIKGSNNIPIGKETIICGDKDVTSDNII